MRHRESIGAGTVEAAVEAGNKHEIRAGNRCDHVVNHVGRHSGGVAKAAARGRPQPDPRPEVVCIGDLTDVHGIRSPALAVNVQASTSPVVIAPVCIAPLVSGPPSSPFDTVIGPGVCVIVS